MIRRWVIVGLLCSPASLLIAGVGDSTDWAQRATRHAETYYALGLVEQGDANAARAGLDELQRADDLLKRAPFPSEGTELVKGRIRALRADLEEQFQNACWTFRGVFPLSGFLTSSLLARSGPTASYRLLDDPAVWATRKAAADLAARAEELEKRHAQLPVVIACTAGSYRLPARTLEHAVRQEFRGTPLFQVQTHAAVAEAIGAVGEVGNAFGIARSTPAVEQALVKAFGPRLLVVLIQQADAVGDLSYYETQGRILDAESPSQAAFSTSAFGRDRRDRLAWIVWANAALLAVAYAAYWLIAYTHRAMAGGNSWATALLVPLAAFAVGRIVPLAVTSLLGSVRPPPETPALAALWFPCLAGIGFLGGPLLAYWLAAPWLAELWPSLSPGNRGGALFVAMGAGIAAYLAGPVLLYLEHDTAIDVALMAASVMVLAYLLGRTLDRSDPLPMSWAFVPLLLMLPVGAAIQHADTAWLAIATATVVAGWAAVVLGSATLRNRRFQALRSSSSPAGRAATDAGVPADAQELARRAESPGYQPLPSFDRAWQHVSGLVEGRCCHLGLFGGRGAGKTATVQAMTARLAEESESKGVRPAVLCGSCPQPISEPIAYAPFREALAQHFEVNLLAPPGPKMRQIGQALGGLFGSVVPFGRILFPHSSAAGDAAAKPDEIHASIAWMLRRLSRTRPVLLCLDDVQWLDEASAALVKYLLAEFPAGSNTPVAIVLVADRRSCLADLGLDVGRSGVELTYPSLAEQAQILVRGVGLHAGVAEELLTRTGAARETDGGLLWPLQVAAKLARSGALRRTEEGFAWAGGAWPADFALPAHMHAAIQQQWDATPQYHAVLACAACGCDGCEFRVGTLADALGRTRLDLLLVLDEIERTTGMVHDVRDRDDVYAFHSSFLLEAIRGQLNIAGHGPRQADVPQIVREYHARLAAALEAALKTSESKLYEVANHFYAAGARYAAKGVEYCLKAAEASAAGYDFRRARKYLEMAEECGELAAAGPLVETERQVLLCREAQVASQGPQRAQAAAAALEYLAEHPAAPARLVLAAARLCYDVGHRGHEPKWYDDAARLCRQIIARPASPQEEAEARHIMAVSQPLDNHPQRVAELRKAYGLLEHAAAEDREASRSLAEIVVSLAKELGKGPAGERGEATQLFQRRLQLDAERHLDDPRGVGMALAGLGRLEWYGEPKDVAAAEEHFGRSLEISEAIGDLIAQVKMHSLLGACGLEKGDADGALAHYQRSWQLAGDRLDRCFAAVGLLRCYQRQNRPDGFEAVARDLLGLLDGGPIPPDCESQLGAVLKTCPVESSSETVRRLRELAQRSA